MNYVLITAVRNEEALIEHTLRSVVTQTVLPRRWVIVDDGSTDRTAAIVSSYVERFPWLELLSRPPRQERSFAGKAHAVNSALERMRSTDFEIVGNLDGDVSFDPDYIEFVLQQFQSDPQLGVAGTPFTESGDYDSARDSFEGENYVAGPFQLFRARCFSDIGGYVPNAAGGVDWIAVMTARMKGWTVRSFPQKRFHHHRSMGTAQRGVVAALFSYGEKDYYLGGSPVWQVFRVAYRMLKKPYVIGGLALLAGYSWAAVRRVPRPVTQELMAFHRKDQYAKAQNDLVQDPQAEGRRRLLYPSSGAAPTVTAPRIARTEPVAVLTVLQDFVSWLQRYGETSRDHQTFFAGRAGRSAKRLYYRHSLLGLPAVGPLIACEAALPSARRWFHRDTRFPIADAHYAMGFAFLHEVSGERTHLDRAIHFLRALEQSRCAGFDEYCWGYPFDWVTRNGTIAAQTPLITTTPYVFEAFLQVDALDGRDEWKSILRSIARHACVDIKDFPRSPTASTCSYTPFDGGGVINAAAYRAFMLTSASKVFGEDAYWATAERNLNFVLEAQNDDGSWYYAVDGVRDFVDHFHTCFVMKALAKIHTLTGHAGCLDALSRGLDYYQSHLFDTDGLPRPFARAPRLTVYKRELYDCAECINLCILLRDRFPACNATLDTVVSGIVRDWVKPDGSFRSRKLFWGWDDVPMHRWAQSQMFRSLAFWLRDFVRNEPAWPGSDSTHQLSGYSPTA